MAASLFLYVYAKHIYSKEENMKFKGISVALVLEAVFLTGCQDNKLAQALEGKWIGNFDFIIKDETPYTQTLFYRFKYKESNKTDGGIFSEYRSYSMEETIEEDNLLISYTVRSSIAGRYEVLFGDLILRYDPNTLSVTIDDVDMSVAGDPFSTDEIRKSGNASTEIHDTPFKEEITKAIQKNVLEEFYQQYKQENINETVYKCLTITGDTTLIASDGLISLKRVNN